MVLNVYRNRSAYWGRGEGGKGVWRWGGGGREIILVLVDRVAFIDPLSLHYQFHKK